MLKRPIVKQHSDRVIGLSVVYVARIRRHHIEASVAVKIASRDAVGHRTGWVICIPEAQIGYRDRGYTGRMQGVCIARLHQTGKWPHLSVSHQRDQK